MSTVDRQKKAADPYKHSYFNGMGRTLLIWFSLFSLTPLIVLGYLNYVRFRAKVVADVERNLSTVADNKADYLNAYFAEILLDVEAESEYSVNTDLMGGLIAAWQESGDPLDEFVRSSAWEIRVSASVDNLRKLCRTQNYYDILMMDIQGNVLLSTFREALMGQNLREPGLADSMLGKAFARTVSTGNSSLSDFEPTGQDGSVPQMYATSILIDDRGDILGCIAFLFPCFEINHLLAGSRDLGENGDVFLIGSDLVLRSNSELMPESRFLREEVESEIARHWSSDRQAGQLGQTRAPSLSYRNHHGHEVYGTHSTVNQGGTAFGLIVEMDRAEALGPVTSLLRWTWGIFGITAALAIAVAGILSRRISTPIRQASTMALRIADGDFSRKLDTRVGGEIGQLTLALNKMLGQLAETREKTDRDFWVQSEASRLKEVIFEQKTLDELVLAVVSEVCRVCAAEAGALYLYDGDKKHLNRVSHHALQSSGLAPPVIRAGEGLAGQVALDGHTMELTAFRDSSVQIISAFTSVKPEQVICFPVVYGDEILGVLELVFIRASSLRVRLFLDEFLQTLGNAIKRVMLTDQTRKLLEETQAQAQLLREQQEELQSANEELEEKSEELVVQQEELKASNEELEEQSESLVAQRLTLERQNLDLQETRDALELKAHQLQLSTQYKSEFLANMSHELRTPLNSILLLSKDLEKNKEQHLDEEEVKAAGIIARSGQGLLNLINDILDLSKIEAGKVQVKASSFELGILKKDLDDLFARMAKERGLDFEVNLLPQLPGNFFSDQQKVAQILRNLVSNALKFTEKGKVVVDIGPDLSPGLETADGIVLLVSDTGIGIPKEKQGLIFEAFQQIDSGLARNYAGTGLGLSITCNLIQLVGGSITLKSEPGSGSTFKVVLPSLKAIEGGSGKTSPTAKQATSAAEIPVSSAYSPVTAKSLKVAAAVADDRNSIQPTDTIIQVIEDDPDFATILRKFISDRGLKCLISCTGESGLQMIREFRPHAILLDLNLPDISGETVVETLKAEPELRHIPIHILTGMEISEGSTLSGVIGVLRKPVSTGQLEAVLTKLEEFISRSQRSILLVFGDEAQRQAVRQTIGDGDVITHEASSGKAAFEILEKESIDCIVIDLGLPDMSGFEFLAQLQDLMESAPPVIVYSDRQLTPEELIELESKSKSIILKGEKSEERLFDETALFLHRVVANLPKQKQQIISDLYDTNKLLRSKRVLIVDDDMKNLYTLSRLLRGYGMKVTQADSGERALELCKGNAFDIILMDIMMPKMDGLVAIQKVRAYQKQNSQMEIPIIAVTAKAMREDRGRCLEAGANDYLTKPVHAEKLFSLLRIWLY